MGGNRCGPPPLIRNAVASLNQASRSVTITCLRGHRFPDGLTVKMFYCHADGSWDYNILRCDVVYCPALPLPLNGTLSTSDTVYNTLVIIECDVGFKHANDQTSKTVLCLDSVTWNDTAVDCQAIQCNGPDLPNFANAKTIAQFTGLFPYAHEVIYACDSGGHRFEGGDTTTTVTCSATGWAWNPIVTSCGPNRCSPVPVVQHAVADSYLAVQGSVVQYTCIDGFSTSSHMSTACDGINWIPAQLPGCEVVHCSALDTTYAEINSRDTTFGVTVNISCLLGYRIIGQSTAAVHCTSTGQWSLNDTCLPVDCGPPDGVDNTVLSTMKSTTYNNSVTFHCVPGYWFYRGVYAMTSTCRADALWTSLDVRSCKPISCPTIVFRVVSSTETSVGTVVNVSCPAGQKLQTGHTMMKTWCTRSGDWSPHLPDCVDSESIRPEADVVEAEGAKYTSMMILVTCFLPICVLMSLDLLKLVTWMKQRPPDASVHPDFERTVTEL